MPALDWGRSYQEHTRMRTEQLQQARARGDCFFRIGMTGAVVDPRRMSDAAIGTASRRDAERVVNRAIIEHNEQAGREGS